MFRFITALLLASSSAIKLKTHQPPGGPHIDLSRYGEHAPIIFSLLSYLGASDEDNSYSLDIGELKNGIQQGAADGVFPPLSGDWEEVIEQKFEEYSNGDGQLQAQELGDLLDSFLTAEGIPA